MSLQIFFQCADDLDRTPPVIFNCPGNISTHTVSGAASVCWSEPFASDDSGVAFQVSFPQFSPGNFIPVGEHDIIYSFSDLFGNEATCRFRITVSSGIQQSCISSEEEKLVIEIERRVNLM